MKKRVTEQDLEDFSEYRALLAALSDDLSLPLLQIKMTLEILDGKILSSKASAQHTRSMFLSAEAGLQLIEAYRLALRANDIDQLQLEPVAIGSVLQEVAENLSPYADQYATDLEVDVQGKLTPVLTHRPSLMAALECLGSSMIRAQAASNQQRRHRLMLGAHKVADSSIATGVFSDVQGLSDKTLRTARSLVGHARQPLPTLPAGTASGVLIADMLCGAMWQPLRAAAHRRMNGLATAIPLSKQLQFV
jgi:hypothetical protein